MDKLKSWEDLKQYRENTRGQTSLLTDNADRIVLAVGEATCGIAAGAKKIADVLRDEIQKQGLTNVSVIATGCYGYCYAEPMVEVRMPQKSSVYYGYVSEDVARDIVIKHLMQNTLVEANILPVEVTLP